MEQLSALSLRALMNAYLSYLGFDVFGDWEYYSVMPEDKWEQEGWTDIWAASKTGGKMCIRDRTEPVPEAGTDPTAAAEYAEG